MSKVTFTFNKQTEMSRLVTNSQLDLIRPSENYLELCPPTMIAFHKLSF